MKKLLNKISASLICATLFSTIFVGVSILLAIIFFGTDFAQKVLSTHTLTEKLQQGIAFYLSAMLSTFLLLLICNHRKLFKSSYRLMAIGGVGGILMLPLTIIVSYLLSGSVISFETIFVVVMLPLLLRFFLIVPFAIALLSGVITGLVYFGYRKLFYSTDITALPELTA